MEILKYISLRYLTYVLHFKFILLLITYVFITKHGLSSYFLASSLHFGSRVFWTWT